MIKSWVKYTLCFVVVFLILVFSGVYWLVTEAKEAWWVVERFGGFNVVDDRSVASEGMDDIYIRSLRLKPQQDIVYDLRALEPCREYSRNCMLQDSAGINLFLISARMVLTDVNKFFEKYKSNVEFFEGDCPVVYETTAVVKEVAALRDLSEEDARLVAQEKMKKIKNYGGLTYSLATPACRRFFRKKPYMARAYIGHLTLLMRVAEGRFSASWAILSELPSIRSTVR